MVTPVQDWRSIDESNISALRDDIPIARGSRRKEYIRLNASLDAMLEIKAVATENELHVPGLSKLIDMYFQTVAHGKYLREQGWLKRIQNIREWQGSEDEFKSRCERVWFLAHQTSYSVHKRADKSEVSIRRRRSLDVLVQAEPELVQQHSRHGDTPMRPTTPNVEPVAQSSIQNSINTSTIQEETVQRIAVMTAAKTLEQFILHGKLGLFGGIPQTVNHFNGCIVRPGGRATHTVNFGGKNNRGAAVNIPPSPTEVEGSSVDDIDGTSDDEALHDTANDATRSVSERNSSPAISSDAQNNNPILISTQSLTGTHPAIDDGEDPHYSLP